jgi:diguanylate cyclase (GGDEF)-like protein/putative nucleotidyltransferase with HDIG domain
LTGLLNHRTLLDHVDAMIATGQAFALLLIDVDDFKLFNDTHGHLVGDAVLAQIAGTLRDLCRDGDAAGRYGGDEFALLLRGLSEEDAAKVKRRLDRAVRARPYSLADGTLIPLSVSTGIACFPVHGGTRQELLAIADADMYAAKRARGGRRSLAREVRMSALSSVIELEAADLLGDSPLGVLEGLVAAVDAKDRYTREHSDDVTRLALLLAAALDLRDDQRRVLALAGALHDVGKIAVPDRVLRKPGKLTSAEYELVRRHVAYGVALIRGVLEDDAVVEAVAHHHERWDGCGYPAGLPGTETPLLGRIMQVADAVSAMMLDRPYRRGLAWEQVVTELQAHAGTQFDPSLVEVFIAAAGPAQCGAESA